MTKSFERVLVLSPHTDDGELGAGGLIAKFIEEGTQVEYLAFSACEDSVPSDFPKDILRKEVIEACSKLGLKSKHVNTLNFQVRRFSERRQNILDEMILIKKQFEPELVLCPSLKDIHQDHSIIAHEALRAFKQNCLISYELPWNNPEFKNQLSVSLSENQVLKKCAAIECYKSQEKREYMQKDYIMSLAKTRGCQVGKPLAEMYEVIKWII